MLSVRPAPLLSRRAFLVGGGAATASAALTGCVSTNPATGRSSFTGVYSLEDDIKLGTREYPKLVEAFGGAYEDRRLNGYVTGIGNRLARLTETPQLPYEFTVLDSPVVNAFALPGGKVAITRGAIALASNEAELAGVLGHELGHVNARHTAERLSQGMLAQLGVAVLGIATGSQAVTQMASGVAASWIQSYSRDQEFEADMLGVRYMSRGGYDPEAMVSFLATLRQQAQVEARMMGLPEGQVDEMNFMSTHPRTIDRTRRAMEQASEARPANPKLGREALMEQINGMIFGDSPQQGIVYGRRFAHPGLGFQFVVPEGFRMTNRPSQVVAQHPDDSVIVFDMARPQKSRDLVAYLRQEWAPRLALSQLERLKVNGLDGATGAGRSGEYDLRLVALDGPSGQVFRFLFATPRGRMAQRSESFRRTTYSFERLDPAEAARIQPMRLIVAYARPDDRLDRLAANLPYQTYNEDWFRLLNDIPEGRPLPTDRPLKIVARAS
ncbi:M48 family metalloprotease [Roseospirillum parvum]|uniref:Putative Zn-dependent protease n=1 Tax=Roseospirillum parvum TaxID=83401 RepID=A0A1G7U371_9PROT|nr:M48 family metalloprotease [Roseospirillum parvum]SDG42085.1 Putative Zn-dependent protease [Roseospirillum parvum]